VPTQWIAKQYTELLGRAPTKYEFDIWSAYYDANVCTAGTLGVLGRNLARSAEFASRYAENNAYPAKDALNKAIRISALVRATFNHDLNQPWDWDSLASPYISGSKDWIELTDEIYTRIGFVAWVVPQICDASSAGYGFAYSTPLDIRQLTGNGSSRTHAQLQAELNAAGPGGLVTLQPGEVVRIGGAANGQQGLVVPSGVTLRTVGSPDPRAYASMGRIVPVSGGNVCSGWSCNNAGIVSVDAGATLRNVWVEGHGASALHFKQANIEIRGSTSSEPTKVSNNRITNPVRDGTGIRVRRNAAPIDCEGALVKKNLITAYTSAHKFDGLGQALWADGIAVLCEGAIVRRNTIVDATDTGIMMYGSYRRTPSAFAVQRSKVSLNTVISAGSDAHVALGADGAGECFSVTGWYAPCFDSPNIGPTFEHGILDENSRPFINAKIKNNEFWTGSRTSFDVGLMIGSGPRAGNHSIAGRADPLAPPGTTSILVHKNTSTPDTRVNIGIAVMGMRDAVVTKNSHTFVTLDGNPAQDYGKCPESSALVGSQDVASLTTDITGIDTLDVASGCVYGVPSEGGMERIGIVDTKLAGLESSRPFVPYGMSFGLERGAALIEERWANDDWEEIVADLRDLKRMGATFTRVRLQYRKFFFSSLNPAWQPVQVPTPEVFADLHKFVDLAAQAGLHVSLSGLRIQLDAHLNLDDDFYSSVSNGVNALEDEAYRWAAQADYWREMAKTLRDSSAVAWYDLMNEPHIPFIPAGGEAASWCWGALADNCFVQNITKTPNGRSHSQIARDWMEKLIDAIKDEGDSHLISLGVAGILRKITGVDGLGNPIITDYIPDPCPGPFGQFPLDPRQDFYSTHVYPRIPDPNLVTDDDWIQATKACKPVDAPMVVDEISDFLSSAAQAGNFIAATSPEVAGWSAHYYGRTPQEILLYLDAIRIPGAGFGGQPFEFQANALDIVMFREWMARAIFKTQVVGGGTVQP
jgi:hypothetical protein